MQMQLHGVFTEYSENKGKKGTPTTDDHPQTKHVLAADDVA